MGPRMSTKIGGENWITEIPGKLQVILDHEIGARCSQTKNHPKVTVVDAQNRKQTLVVQCQQIQSRYVAHSSQVILPGKYKIEVDAASELLGKIAFLPVDPEKLSGADKGPIGATKLADGVQANSVHSSRGDTSDWWVLEVKELTSYTIQFEHNADSALASAQLYSRVGQKNVLVAKLNPDQPLSRRMEGTYFIHVKGAEYTGSIEYSLSLQKGETATQVVERQSQDQDIQVRDLWHLDGKRTAVLLGIGKNMGIKEGSTLRLFDAQRKPVSICIVMGSSDAETECHTDQLIPLETKILARRSL